MSETTPAAVPEPVEPASAEPRGLSRRTIVTAAAWSVPAIVLATATPAAAVSNPTMTLSITPPTQAVGLGGTSTNYTVTALTLPGGTPDSSAAIVTITLPAGFVFASGGTAGSNVWSFPTDGLSKVFTVLSNGTGSTTGTITVTSAVAETVSATVQAVGFAGWGYNVASQGQVRTDAGNQTTVFYMTDTAATTAVTAMGGSWAALLWADQDGHLWGRGYNAQGVIGWNNPPTHATTPQRAATAAGVPLAKTIVHIARGTDQEASMAVASDGTVWAAGFNQDNGFAAASYLQNGFWQQVATHTTFTTSAGAGVTVKKVEIGANGTALFLLSDGRVLASGNTSGGASAQGPGGTVNGQPMLLTGGTPITGATEVGIGGDMSAVIANGQLYTAGNAAWGGSGTSFLSAKPLPGARTPSKLAVGQRTMLILATDGTVWGLGDNGGGVFGRGDRMSSANFLPTPAILPGPAKAVAYGENGALFLLTDGRVFFAGWDDVGGRGDGGGDTNSDTPVQVPGLPANVTWIGTNFWDSVYAFG